MKGKKKTMSLNTLQDAEVKGNVAAFEQSMEIVQKALPVSIKWLDAVALDTMEEFRECSNDLVALEGALTKADIERKKFTQPLNDVKKSIDAKYKVATGPIQKWADHLRTLVEQFTLETRRKEVAAVEKKAEKFRAKGAEQLADDMVSKALVYSPPTGTRVTFRDVWEYESTDIIATAKAVVEGKLPPEAIVLSREYWKDKAKREKGALDEFGVKGKLIISSVVGA